ncbi:hypothetical protein ABIJ78_004314 [Salmonella enterica]|uniref:Lipoprotein n=1 Tax=Salmonella enterica subsp. enterica serovar Bareilly TaxID=58096 RepID=A0A637Y131_SALET|nr:hypothetical protein [Salmonella enterica]ECX1324540.1 hypothetical protein [Salmonella enterica subsp. enterica serovar Muenchen]EAM1698817.1 hypothetical protein [Salmonella enterica]EAO2961173.1 hypothetical protein [Salmonella enterica]EAO8996127.1 hypothetical protein [Salmonella enterica]EAR7716944.1 hypothetical protein [Salmonella enterica]
MKKLLLMTLPLIAVMLTGGCRSTHVRSPMTPVVNTATPQLQTFEILSVSTEPTKGAGQISLMNKSWYANPRFRLTREDLASLYLQQDKEGNTIIYLKPSVTGLEKLRHMTQKYAPHLLMLVGGRAVSLSSYRRADLLPFYVGDDKKTREIAGAIVNQIL